MGAVSSTDGTRDGTERMAEKSVRRIVVARAAYSSKSKCCRAAKRDSNHGDSAQIQPASELIRSFNAHRGKFVKSICGPPSIVLRL